MLEEYVEAIIESAERRVKPLKLNNRSYALSAGPLVGEFDVCYRYSELVDENIMVVAFVCKRGSS